MELQQVEIHRLNEWKRSHLAGEHNISEPSLSAAEMKAKEERGTREAHETLKKVLHKHNHQREKREFVAPKPSHGEERQKGMHVKHGTSAGKERSELLQLGGPVALVLIFLGSALPLSKSNTHTHQQGYCSLGRYDIRMCVYKHIYICIDI